MLLSKSYSPFFFHIHTEDQPVVSHKRTAFLNFCLFMAMEGCEGGKFIPLKSPILVE